MSFFQKYYSKSKTLFALLGFIFIRNLFCLVGDVLVVFDLAVIFLPSRTFKATNSIFLIVIDLKKNSFSFKASYTKYE